MKVRHMTLNRWNWGYLPMAVVLGLVWLEFGGWSRSHHRERRTWPRHAGGGCGAGHAAAGDASCATAGPIGARAAAAGRTAEAAGSGWSVPEQSAADLAVGIQRDARHGGRPPLQSWVPPATCMPPMALPIGHLLQRSPRMLGHLSKSLASRNPVEFVPANNAGMTGTGPGWPVPAAASIRFDATARRCSIPFPSCTPESSSAKFDPGNRTAATYNLATLCEAVDPADQRGAHAPVEHAGGRRCPRAAGCRRRRRTWGAT